MCILVEIVGLVAGILKRIPPRRGKPIMEVYVGLTYILSGISPRIFLH